jgi:DNA invertase Pin-like site-specific DNA recombinase
VALIGYARVSTVDQDPEMQIAALEQAGCESIFTEHASGADPDRPELAATLRYLRRSDTLVVWKLDRLGRSLKHLIQLVEGLAERGVAFRSLTEGFDTSTPGGELIFHIMGALAQFERTLIAERTRVALAERRAKGMQLGRKKVITPDRLTGAQRMLDSGEYSVTSVARVLGVGRSTLYRALDNA